MQSRGAPEPCSCQTSSELAPPGPPAVGRRCWLQPLLLQKRGHQSPGRAALNEHQAVAPRRLGQTGGHGEVLPSPRPGRSAAYLGRVLTQQSLHHRSPPRFLLSVEYPSPALSTQAWPLPPWGTLRRAHSVHRHLAWPGLAEPAQLSPCATAGRVSSPPSTAVNPQ